MPSLDPPVPVDGLINPGFNFANVTFDRNLLVGPLDAPNWHVRWQNMQRPTVSANVGPGTPAVVALTMGAAVPDPGPDAVSYSPPPADVISDTVRPIPAAAFADFPLHV